VFALVIEKRESRRFEDKETVCEEGDKGDSFFIISAGAVEVFRKEGAKITVVTELKEGAFFGMLAFFANSKRTASVRAKGDADMLEITKKAFKDIITEFPKVTEAMEQFYKDKVLSALLATCPIFSPFSIEERQELAERFELAEFERGDAIIEEGEMGDAMYVIRRGEVEVTKLNPKRGTKIHLAKLNVGDFFGEIALIKNTPRTATITATKKTNLMKLSKEEFDRMILENPTILEVISDYTDKRLKDLQASMTKELKDASKAAV
jgi:CRP-like cAMP-binding protein